MRNAILAVTIALAGFAQAASPSLALDPALEAVLARSFHFSPADLADISRGKVVKHTLDGNTPGEVAAVGAIRINAPLDRFLTEFRDIVSFKRDTDVLEIGRFSSPPTLEDLAPLTITDDDLDARHCRLKDCDVRLPGHDIARFEREVDWGRPDAKTQAASLFKTMLLEHVRAYWSGGPGRIDAYDDGEHPIKPAEEFAGILSHSRFLSDLVPDLLPHLRDFPQAPLEGAEDFLYWSKERFGIAPFITVTHVTIARTRTGALVITSKDVYSSRYFDSSLGATIAADTGDGRFVLVYLNRSRANALKGPLSGLRRAIVERRARGSLDESLRRVRVRVEAN